MVEELFSKIEGRPIIAHETEEDQVVAGLVAAGFGIAVVPYMDMLLLRLDVKIIQTLPPLGAQLLPGQRRPGLSAACCAEISAVCAQRRDTVKLHKFRHRNWNR